MVVDETSGYCEGDGVFGEICSEFCFTSGKGHEDFRMDGEENGTMMIAGEGKNGAGWDKEQGRIAGGVTGIFVWKHFSG